MDIEKIISFCTIVEQGSFSRAAQVLYCSQPAISKQIISLEREYGYPLFNRSGKKGISYQFGKHLQREKAYS